MSADVYALYSTRNGRVRYVGQSLDRVARFKDHLRSAESSKQSPLLDRWFHQEWRDGYPVRYALLEECDDGERHQVEERWIWRFPWADLLNRRKRPPWWQPQPLKPPRVDKIDDYMRRHRFNIEGRRGVHRERETGYYRVLVYNGRWVRWLEGGDEGGIWFSDLARALSARDGEEDFYRELMKDRRQADIVAARAREEERIARGDWGL